VAYSGGSGDVAGAGYSTQGSGVPSAEAAGLTHEEASGLLSPYASDELDERVRAELSAHLARCVACAANLATLRATVDLLRSLASASTPQPLRQRLLAIPDQPEA
jgi:anti-sigma factor RsiW